MTYPSQQLCSPSYQGNSQRYGQAKRPYPLLPKEFASLCPANEHSHQPCEIAADHEVNQDEVKRDNKPANHRSDPLEAVSHDAKHARIAAEENSQQPKEVGVLAFVQRLDAPLDAFERLPRVRSDLLENRNARLKVSVSHRSAPHQLDEGGARSKKRGPGGHSADSRQPRLVSDFLQDARALRIRVADLLPHAIVLLKHQIDMRELLAQVDVGDNVVSHGRARLSVVGQGLGGVPSAPDAPHYSEVRYG